MLRPEQMVLDSSWQDANQLACTIAGETDTALYPFDTPFQWRGRITMLDEMATVWLRPDFMVLSDGGGNFMSGVLEELARNSLVSEPVSAMETEDTGSYRVPFAVAQPVETKTISVVATSQDIKRVCNKVTEYVQFCPVINERVMDTRLNIKGS